MRTKQRIRIGIVAALVCIAVLSALGACTQAQTFELQAVDRDADGYGAQAYAYMQRLTTDFADRTSGGASDGDKKFAFWAAAELSAMGYTPIDRFKAVTDDADNPVAGVGEFSYEFDDSNKDREHGKSYNVTFVKPCENPRGTIVIAAGYDNVYADKAQPTGVEGSYQSAAEIAMLLTIAQALRDAQLPYRVEFVLLGQETYGYIGSYRYYEALTVEERAQIAMFVSLDHPVGGDRLYLYGRDKQTDYQNYFYAVARANGYTAQDVPADKHVVRAALFEDGRTQYFHSGMIGHHVYFQDAGIPTLSVASRNWEADDNPVGTERAGMENVLYTERDTLLQMNERMGGHEATRLALGQATALLIGALVDYPEQLTAALDTARMQEVGRTAQSSVTNLAMDVVFKIAVIGALLGVVFWIRKRVADRREYYQTRMQQAHPPVEPVKPIDVFGLDSDDPDADRSKNDSDGGNADDLFG